VDAPALAATDHHLRHGRALAVSQVLGAATLWGVSGVVARSLFLHDVDPAHLVQVRMLIGGLALLPVVALRGSAIIARRHLLGVAGYAAMLVAVQLFYFEAIAAAGVAVAIFLQYTAPLLVGAWEAVRARRMPSAPVATALAIAVAGSGLLVLPGSGVHVPAAGFAWGIAAAFGMAGATVAGGALRRRGVRATPLLAYGLVLGSFAFAPVRTPWSALAAVPLASWPYFAYVAIFATAVPFTLYAAALSALPGSVAILLAMLEPVLAVVLAWAILGEALTPLQIAGGALILAAIALTARSRE
jgi:drug/metabolite transporter (DMT)-like permease